MGRSKPEKTKSQKRKGNATSEPNATGLNTGANKNLSKKPNLVGEQKTSTKPPLEDPNSKIPILHLHARPPHAKKTPKAHTTASKEAEIKELGW